MRKFFLCMIIVLVMVLSIGCGQNNAQPTEAKGESYNASEADFDAHGYKAEISVTYEEGKIVKVLYNDTNKDGAKKREDAKYNEAFKKTSGLSADEASAALEQQLIDKQNAADIEVVSGATDTSKRFKILAEEATAQKQ